MLIAPKTTRLALPPCSGTGAGAPRKRQPARSGGKRSRSVSSSNSRTLRAGRPRSRRRRARFFVALGVGLQYVAGPLPDKAHGMQLPTDGGGGQVLASGCRQVFAQQVGGPFDRLVAEVAWRGGQGLPEDGPQVGRPRRRVVAAPVVEQRGGVAALVIAGEPVVDAYPAGTQQ